jgi:hypothetical protein
MLKGEPTGIEPAPWTLRGSAIALVFRRGVLAFIRYTESNVGPYDELLWLAPFQRGPEGRAHQVPAIFVSSQASAQSGRANWGLPKELAEFRVSALTAESELVQVTRAGRHIASFVRGRPHGRLPVEFSKLPARARRLVQISDGRGFHTVPAARARLGLTLVSDLQVNRELLPHARSSRWRLGLQMSSLELLFPVARLFELSRSME